MTWPLFERIPREKENAGGDAILDRFLDYVRQSEIELYPAQEEAILELFSGRNVVLNTPTGSGKSLVATALHFESLSAGRRSVYTCPIKALVNEKFMALCRDFGPNQVGMITGDATVNPDAPLLCCTAEILAIDALRLGENAPYADIIMDEFHYYSDRERGVAWQIPLLTLTQSRFLLMSATLGDTQFFESVLTRLTGRETVTIRSYERPVALEFEYSEMPLHDVILKLIRGNKAPIYLVSFTQRECAEEAQNLLSVDFCTKEEKKTIAEALEGYHFSSPYGKEIQKFLKHGVGLHHAGLLPKYRVLVERLAQRGLLKIICGTDTLGVGVNIPIRTVLLTKLCKFDGDKTTLLSVRDFLQISGRAGRKGYDDKGYVVVQAPEHVIENLRLEQKAGNDPKKQRKIVKRKPPEKGYVPWNKETFQKLVTGQPEPLLSRFKVTHAMILHLLSRPRETVRRSIRQVVKNSHESSTSKKHHIKTGFELFRSLVDRKIIELNPLRLNVDLQEDFSLNHALSLYLLDTIHLLDPNDSEYALDLLSLVESILENPDLVLKRQLDKLKSEKMQELKLAGVEYDERIEELEKLEYPKPNRDFIYDTFNDFSAAHPWVGQENIRPKSIAREMYETYQSFSDYVKEYDLRRAEGILLRYLSDVYKTLVQTVPDVSKNEEIHSILVYLGTLVRDVDSSLLDEWERMRNPGWVKAQPTSSLVQTDDIDPSDITRNPKEFLIRVRNEIFRFVKTLASHDYETALKFVEPDPDRTEPWTSHELEKILQEYHLSGHTRICTDTRARSPKNTLIETESASIQASGGASGTWRIQQILIDPDEQNDWGIDFILDLDRSRQNAKPYLILAKIAPF